MAHLPFSTHGLFFMRSGFRNGSLGIPSSIHLRSLWVGKVGRVRLSRWVTGSLEVRPVAWCRAVVLAHAKERRAGK